MTSVRKVRHYLGQRLTIKQITALSDYCLQNASELVEEAKLLFSNKRYARSFFLSVLALEEASKRDILWQAIFLGEDEKEWKEFWNKFLNHDIKITTMLWDHITVYSNKGKNTPREILSAHLREMKRAEGEAKEISSFKEWAMYVDVIDGQPIMPSQVVDRKFALTMLESAQKHLEHHRQFKPTAREIETNLRLRKKMKKGESFIDYWYRTRGNIDRGGE
jgi:AbiV family abortive infection protein